MKTNNVDFGKIFKFKYASDYIVYTCHKADEGGFCKVTWDEAYQRNPIPLLHNKLIVNYIENGAWIVLPSESTDNSHNTEEPTENTSEDSLLNEIKSFTATSKHSVNIYNGAYEVFRSGEDMAYQCKDDETLRSVLQALKVLDGAT